MVGKVCFDVRRSTEIGGRRCEHVFTQQALSCKQSHVDHSSTFHSHIHNDNHGGPQAKHTHTITNHRNGENGFPAGAGCATPKGPLPPKPPPNGPAPPTTPLLPLANGLSNGEDCAAGAEPNGDDLVSDDVDIANGEEEGSAVLNGVEVGNAAQQNNTRENSEQTKHHR